MKPSPAPASKTVLIGVDAAAVADRFRAAIERAGHKTVAVKSAAALVERARAADAVDLIILDIGLAGGDRVSLPRSLASIDRGRVPIMIFSGSVANAAEARELSAAGIAGYINEYSPPQQIVPALAPHLFPDSFNRRGGPRVALGIPIQYRYGNTIAAALTLNLGRGGIAIRTTSPLEAGAKVRVRFRAPGSRHDVEADGRVAWQDRRVGMGIQFESLEPSDERLIDQYVDAHFSRKS
jgi:uncharacterized protein (TIGR02266 family)